MEKIRPLAPEVPVPSEMPQSSETPIDDGNITGWESLSELSDAFDPHNWEHRSSFVAAETAPLLTEELSSMELSSRPEKRFNVNPDAFPIFRDQVDNITETLNINETLARFVTRTADTVALLSGETDPPSRPSDAVIYLDKSARPVSWLVDEFWQDFSNRPEPPRENFLAIDRIRWFRSVGMDIDGQGNFKSTGEKATFQDFQRSMLEHPVPRSDIARARLALIPGGIATVHAGLSSEQQAELAGFDPLAFQSRQDDEERRAPDLPPWLVDKIFATPTGLEGKKITVIDEVANSGATAEIAKFLVEQAVNDHNTEVVTHVFWKAGYRKSANGEMQMLSSPVWYDHDVNPEAGKGIGDINFKAMRDRFRSDPTIERLNDLYIAPFTGRPLDLAAKEGESTIELQKEIHRMAELYRAGHILPKLPDYYSEEKWEDYCANLGVIFTRDSNVAHSYVNITQSFGTVK